MRGRVSPPPILKGNMVKRGIHVALYEDVEGVKFVFMLKIPKKLNINKVMLLKKKEVIYPKAPELPDPALLARKGTGQIIEPEDIINGTIEAEKPLEPEDIYNAKL
jgi:hypothetical protein